MLTGIACKEVCGDGKHMGRLECDDGNTADGDGCDSKCSIEYGYNCTGGNTTSPDTCRNILNFTVKLDYEDTYDHLLLVFNKPAQCLMSKNYTIDDNPMIKMLSLIKVSMWSASEEAKEVEIKELSAVSTSSILMVLGDVGSVCGEKEVKINLTLANITYYMIFDYLLLSLLLTSSL